MQLESFLESAAQRTPDKEALIFEGQRLAYAGLERRSNRLAHQLVALNLERGDRVAIWLDNSPETVAAIFAVLKAGCVFLVLNPTTKPDKIDYILNNCRARALVTDGNKAASLGADWAARTYLEALLVADPKNPPPAHHSTTIDLRAVFDDQSLPETPPKKRSIDIDLAALIYTSGSTGRPKGVMMTHQNMVAASTSITTYLENVADDIVLCVLPLAFDYGLYQILMAFQVGATVVLEKSFTYPHAVLQAAVREKITGLPIVPTISAILLQMDLKQYDFSSLRYITNTAAALPTHHIFRLRELFPSVRIYSMYGLTECKRVSYLPPEQIDTRPTSVGRGMPNEEVYVVDPDGRRVPPGVPGELVVRGANVMKGYWEDPDETAKRLRPGPFPWESVLYTGDIFQTDEAGYLYFVGRKDDIIKSRGEKVSPKEIEDVLYGLEGIVEAAVVGVDDPVLGQAIKAFVTCRPDSNLTEKDVLRHCSKRLEDFMVPKYVEFRESLPKTATGKISKKEILQG